MDIWNSAGPEKGAGIIYSSQDKLLYEALDILGWFAAWHNDLQTRFPGEGPHASRFFGRELWEDLQCLVLGLVCTCRHYLTLHPGKALVQRRGDQDPCDNHFAHVRGGGGGSASVTAYYARAATTRAGNFRAAGGSGNAGGALVDNELRNAPLLARKR